MKSYASTLKTQGKGKWMHFIPSIGLYSGNSGTTAQYIPVPYLKGQDIEPGRELHREQNKIHKVCGLCSC